ncbi:MAG: PspC domain-containing protein [Candidatus Thorarchaeota archaeon]
MAEIPTPTPSPSDGLYRSRTDRMILGVCGGIAKYYDMNPTLVRIIMFLLTLTVIGLLGYFVIALIVPEEP